MHAVLKKYEILIKGAGAVIGDYKNAETTRSDYAKLRTPDGRMIELRGSDHMNSWNPRTTLTVLDARELRYTAPGFGRALAIWLGCSAADARNCGTDIDRGQRELVKRTFRKTESGNLS